MLTDFRSAAPSVAQRLKGTKMGKVVNNADPLHLGHVQAVIPGFLEGDTDVLPWIAPKMPTIMGGSSGAQFFAVPDVGATLTVEFGDDAYTIFYTGWVPDTGTQAKDPNADQKSNARSAKAAAPEHGQGPQKGNPGDLLGDYPNTFGFVDSNGTSYMINKAQGFMQICHQSGFTWQVDSAGKVTSYIPNDWNVKIGANMLLDIVGDLTIKSKNASIEVQSLLKMLAEIINAEGKSNVLVKSSGSTVVKGSPVDIN